jgi:hypothetical protein
MKLILAVFGLVLPLAGIAGDVGYAAKDLEIRSEPRIASPVIGQLPRNGRFEILQRQMAWAQISTTNQQGWVLFYFLMNGEPPATSAPRNVMGELLGFGTRQQGTGTVTASIGIRGISEEELKAAKFNPVELTKLESFLAQKPQAASFAQQGQLSQRNVEYLPAPAPENPRNQSAPPGSGGGE